MQMTESEVRGLCLKSREIFLSQPILLELEAPLKICGENIVLLILISTVMCVYICAFFDRFCPFLTLSLTLNVWSILHQC